MGGGAFPVSNPFRANFIKAWTGSSCGHSRFTQNQMETSKQSDDFFKFCSEKVEKKAKKKNVEKVG